MLKAGGGSRGETSAGEAPGARLGRAGSKLAWQRNRLPGASDHAGAPPPRAGWLARSPSRRRGAVWQPIRPGAGRGGEEGEPGPRLPGARMGGSESRLPRDLLGEYQELTFLSKQEILLAHKRFCQLLPRETRDQALQTRVPKSRLLTLPELRANPFRNRICRIFSTAENGEDALSFEDFLDLLSVFSDSATPEIKSHYAFRLFDSDDDGTLDKKDLENLVNSLTGEGEDSRLSSSEMEQLIQNILEESDIDKDGTINLSEFQHIISRSPDFTSSFKIVL